MILCGDGVELIIVSYSIAYYNLVDGHAIGIIRLGEFLLYYKFVFIIGKSCHINNSIINVTIK